MGDSPRIGRLDLVQSWGTIGICRRLNRKSCLGSKNVNGKYSLNGLHCKKDALRASKKSALHSRYLVQSSGWKYSAVTTRITEYHGHVPLPWHCGWGWKIWSQEMNSQMWYKEIKILGEIKMLYWTKNGPAKRSRIWHKCLKSYGNSYFNIYISMSFWLFGNWES